jgi:RNA polymerase sigma factor (sigma-70 family)
MAAASQKRFLQLIEEYKPIIYKIAAVYALSSEGRQDLVLEIVISLWKAFPAFRQEARVSTWIYRVALNTAISNYRQDRYQRRKVALTSEQVFSLPEHPVTDWSEELDLLYQAIQQLAGLDRAIILLYLDEKSYQDISAITGLSSAAVGMRLKRIKEKLMTLIQSTTR